MVTLPPALIKALGTEVESSRPLSGGDINQAFELVLADGRRVFMKTNDAADASMFAAEADGLAWLAEARALRVPEVLAVSEQFLVLELIEPGGRVRDYDERLGRGLADLHRFGAPFHGLDRNNFIGSLPQKNASRDRWSDFYRDQRLSPQLEMAVRRGYATTKVRRSFDALFDRLPELCGEEESPARLHGDLWGGNLHTDEGGNPCLIDPAVYGGHREIDLAMMRLFGGFGERVFSAYDEAFPLPAGHADRVSLYQLYPLMVHVNLFGGGYVGSVESALARYL